VTLLVAHWYCSLGENRTDCAWKYSNSPVWWHCGNLASR
jgi:hypothetical protein